MKNILICDDHPAVRKGIRLIMTNEFPDVYLEEACNGTEALQKIEKQKWSLIILDINMPGRGGLEILQDLKARQIDMPVLLFSMHAEDHLAIRAYKLGASGYLSKSSSDEELCLAIRTILSGRRYITPAMTEKMLDHLKNPSDAMPHELLSERELETFFLLAKGLTVSQIAKKLSLSVQSISTYRMRIQEKTGMRTIADISQYALKNQLI